MRVDIRPKPVNVLNETPLLQQTNYWSKVKENLGWGPLAFDIEIDGHVIGDVLILQKPIGAGRSMAYAPYGPECLPEDTLEGLYLAGLSESLREYLGPSCVFMRWDIPWESPYARDASRYDENREWMGPPETGLQELRMNWGIEKTGLRKAGSNYLPHDTLILDIREDESRLFGQMHPKTRYNIRLAQRHEVRIREGGPDDMPIWNALYRETARRNQIHPHGPEYFNPLLTPDRPEGEDCRRPDGSSPAVKLLIAESGHKPLAAMFISLSAGRATYLYGASSDACRNYMAPYALQWHAIQEAKNASCTSYDFFGVSPSSDTSHPMYGLYRFKKGFGGTMYHRQGAWDYPYNEDAYRLYQSRELSQPGFNI